MNILKRAAIFTGSLILRAAGGSFETTGTADLSTILLQSSSVNTTAGERVSPGKSLTLSAYYAALRAISEDIGKLPITIFRRQANGAEIEQQSNPIYRLIHVQPNEEMGPMAFKETLTACALGWGNGYAEIARSEGGQPTGLFPIHPSLVQLKRDPDGKLVYIVQEGGREVPIAPEDMFHLHGLGPDGLVGWSIARLGAESIGTALATQSYGAGFFGNGTQLSGILSHPKKLTPESRTNLRRSWEERHKGAKRAHRVAVLEEGVQWAATSIPPQDAQFLETRNFQVEEIARWFRIPPHKLQHLMRSTFNNIEHQGIEYVTDTLMAWITRWEEEIARKLLVGTRLHSRFIVNELLRGDQKSRFEGYRIMWGMGAISVNEMRAKENLNPIEGGDTYFVPLNMTTLETAIANPPQPKQPGESAPAPDGGRDESQSQALAIRPLLDSAVSRCNDKERKALARARKRAEAGKVNLGSWYDGFCNEQQGYFIDSLRPILSSIGLNGDTEAKLQARLSNHFADRRGNLRMDAQDGPLVEDLHRIIEEAHASN